MYPRVDPSPDRLDTLVAKYHSPLGPWVPQHILELAATPTRPDQPGRPSAFTRNNTALRLSWLCYLNHIPENVCLELMYVLWEGMEQPERDPYPSALIDRMVQDTYRKGDPDKIKRYTKVSQGQWQAKAVPFVMPAIDPSDPERVRKLWNQGFAAIPIPTGDKGSTRNPKFSHLKITRPSEQEFQKFSRGWYRNGNAALLFGNENEGIHRLYDIEIEHWDDFWNGNTARRDYFMSQTPVMLSAKSAHIFIRSKEVVHSTKIDGVVEFRGANNYTMAPGSIHPSSTPERPVIYQQINSFAGTILDVENVEAFTHHWVPELFPPVIENATPARIEEDIRAGVAFGEHETAAESEPQSGAAPRSVARRAVEAAAKYKEWAVEVIPQVPGAKVRGGSSFMQRKDDPLHAVANGGASDTWQEEGNAVLKRRVILGFYMGLLFDIVEEEDQGAIYQFRRHLSPEVWKENEKWVRRLRSRIRRHHKDYTEFTILEDDGWWLNIFSNYDDPRGNTEPTVADRNDLAPLLVGLGMPEAEYHRKTPVHASRDWRIPESRTNEWRILGARSIPDLLAYREVEDARDAQIAAESGIATYSASDEEIMGRAPEAIQHTRHFKAPPEMQPWQMLEFALKLGFYLFPKVQAELDQQKGQAKMDARAKQRPANRPAPPLPVSQGELSF